MGHYMGNEKRGKKPELLERMFVTASISDKYKCLQD